MKINNESIPIHITEDGQMGFELTPQDAEDLVSLLGSKEYKTYRRILMGAKNAHLQSALALDNPDKLLKQMGMVAGLNLAINQLVLLVDQINKARLVEAESKKPTEPTRQ